MKDPVKLWKQLMYTLRKTMGRVRYGVDVITVTHGAHIKRLAG